MGAKHSDTTTRQRRDIDHWATHYTAGDHHETLHLLRTVGLKGLLDLIEAQHYSITIASTLYGRIVEAGTPIHELDSTAEGGDARVRYAAEGLLGGGYRNVTATETHWYNNHRHIDDMIRAGLRWSTPVAENHWQFLTRLDHGSVVLDNLDDHGYENITALLGEHAHATLQLVEDTRGISISTAHQLVKLGV